MTDSSTKKDFFHGNGYLGVNCLKATGIGHGLLMSFGPYKFEIQKFIHTRPVSE